MNAGNLVPANPSWAKVLSGVWCPRFTPATLQWVKNGSGCLQDCGSRKWYKVVDRRALLVTPSLKICTAMIKTALVAGLIGAPALAIPAQPPSIVAETHNVARELESAKCDCNASTE